MTAWRLKKFKGPLIGYRNAISLTQTGIRKSTGTFYVQILHTAESHIMNWMRPPYHIISIPTSRRQIKEGGHHLIHKKQR